MAVSDSSNCSLSHLPLFFLYFVLLNPFLFDHGSFFLSLNVVFFPITYSLVSPSLVLGLMLGMGRGKLYLSGLVLLPPVGLALCRTPQGCHLTNIRPECLGSWLCWDNDLQEIDNFSCLEWWFSLFRVAFIFTPFQGWTFWWLNDCYSVFIYYIFPDIICYLRCILNQCFIKSII